MPFASPCHGSAVTVLGQAEAELAELRRPHGVDRKASRRWTSEADHFSGCEWVHQHGRLADATPTIQRALCES